MRLVPLALLSSAASLVGVGVASAADLPMAKAAPVEYVRVCAVHGAGFFYIPGSDTCLKISGFVRAEYQWAEPKWGVAGPGSGRYRDSVGFFTRGRLEADARTATDYGLLRAFIRYEIQRTTGVYNTQPGPAGPVNSAYIDKAFIQFAGLTAGVVQSFFDFYADDLNYGGVIGSDNGNTNVLAYTATFGGGFSATISLEDRNERNVDAPYPFSTYVGVLPYSNFAGGGAFPATFYSAAGERIPDVVGVLRVDQAWGSAQLSGAVHQLNSGVNYGASTVDDEYGWAVQGGVKLNLPYFAAGDYLWLQAAYTRGALSYIGVNGNQAIGPVETVATDGAILNGDIKLTTGWNALAALLHYWTPSVRQGIFGGYTEVNYSGSVTAAYGVPDFRLWQVGTNLIWSPVKAFDIGVEVLYQRLDPAGRVVIGANAFGPITKGSEDAVQARLRIQRDF